ncbi:hypothetical protein E6O75_ATG00074 [Venturia nashicola]|uniref:Uncharacterized protein n=1 Tax=Venturia nashicola TaxID=86259 RepID=A0A4Z1PHJ8_9PEZI|nr:hypothetical protein E6O75_ATG00074 [Venturia nashicola]
MEIHSGHGLVDPVHCCQWTFVDELTLRRLNHVRPSCGESIFLLAGVTVLSGAVLNTYHGGLGGGAIGDPAREESLHLGEPRLLRKRCRHDEMLDEVESACEDTPGLATPRIHLAPLICISWRLLKTQTTETNPGYSKLPKDRKISGTCSLFLPGALVPTIFNEAFHPSAMFREYWQFFESISPESLSNDDEISKPSACYAEPHQQHRNPPNCIRADYTYTQYSAPAATTA